MQRLPVIVGAGEVSDRPERVADGKEPAVLMAQALRLADVRGLLRSIDAIDVVKQASWPYADLPARVCRDLGVAPTRAVYGEGSGNSPVLHVHEAALRIARGECEVAAICGAEAQSTVDRARREGVELPWHSEGEPTKLFQVHRHAHPVAVKYGLITPAHIYPLYENATAAAWGQAPRQARARNAALGSAFSEVAAQHPTAWLRRRHGAKEIATATPANRPVAWPYTKLMVAQPCVNLGAAVLMTTLERARAAGFAQSEIVHVWAGAQANEPFDYLARDRYDRSTAQDAVLKAILREMGWERSRFDFAELYSCFPVVPKMAMRTLGMPDDAVPTVTGGMTFFGAPLHDFMLHAIVNLVMRVRGQPHSTALAYGQGGHLTKHHGLVLGSDPPPRAPAQHYCVQAASEAARETIPPLLDSYAGPLRVETHTVVYRRDGLPEYGVVVGRTPAGERALCRIPPSDASLMALFTDLDRSPIGMMGHTIRHEGFNHFVLV